MLGALLEVADEWSGTDSKVVEAVFAGAVDEGQDDDRGSGLGRDVARPAVVDRAPAENGDDGERDEDDEDGPAPERGGGGGQRERAGQAQAEARGEAGEEAGGRAGIAVDAVGGAELALMELHLEPAVDLVLVGADAGLGRAVEAVDGKAEVLFPAAAGADVAAEVGGDLLPGIEDFADFASFARAHRPSLGGYAVLWIKLFIRKGLCQVAVARMGTYTLGTCPLC
jgi:hypothetical protein